MVLRVLVVESYSANAAKMVNCLGGSLKDRLEYRESITRAASSGLNAPFDMKITSRWWRRWKSLAKSFGGKRAGCSNQRDPAQSVPPGSSGSHIGALCFLPPSLNFCSPPSANVGWWTTCLEYPFNYPASWLGDLVSSPQHVLSLNYPPP